MLTLHVPCDSLARAVGADLLAEALREEAERRQLPLEIRRSSSRGMYWLEPLVEVDSAEGRQGFGPLSADQAGALLDALTDAGDECGLGVGDERGRARS